MKLSGVWVWCMVVCICMFDVLVGLVCVFGVGVVGCYFGGCFVVVGVYVMFVGCVWIGDVI